jgi:serine/threonine protein kinase
MANNSIDNQAERAEMDVGSLKDWLRETYHDDDKPPILTNIDLERIGDFLLQLLRYRPSERPSAGEILSYPLFVSQTIRINNLASQ